MWKKIVIVSDVEQCTVTMCVTGAWFLGLKGVACIIKSHQS